MKIKSIQFIVFLCLLMIFSLNSFANKDNYYPISSIPEDLKKNAKAVIRNQELILEILPNNKYKLQLNCVVSILNDNGLDLINLELLYNNFEKISNIEYTIYDQYGKKVKKIDRDEIMDFSAISGHDHYTDYRCKYIEPEYYGVPFTIHYTYLITVDANFYYPDFLVYPDFNISIENKSIKIIDAHNIGYRFKVIDPEGLINFSENKMKTEKTWSVSQLKPLKDESYRRRFSELSPKVIFAPNKFEIDTYEGDMRSWKNIGIWYATLLKDIEKGLSKETKDSLLYMKTQAKGNSEKLAKLVYKYFQRKTRYVSIQEGIKYWQPISAAEIDKYSYGDCKGLSYYLKTLYDFVGIKSCVINIRAGVDNPYFYKDFPSNQFNHVILSLLINSDTIWLECTDQRKAFGYLGCFTDDRYCLMVNGNESDIVKTPVYNEDINIINRKANVSLDYEQPGSAEITTTYGGFHYDFREYQLRRDNKDKERYILETMNIPSMQIDELTYQLELKDYNPNLIENINVSFEGYIKNLGNRIIFPVNITSPYKNLPPLYKNRTHNIYIGRSLTQSDTILYKIPEGFSIEKIPSNIEFESKFGSYFAKMEPMDGKIQYVSKLVLYGKEYPREDYPDFYNFLEKIFKADNNKVILNKNQN